MADGRDHLDALKAAADPERVAAALGLRGRGRRLFCPSCQSDGAPHKSPDLAVMDKGFICHKCGLKGDLLKLIEVAVGLDFKGAVAWLERETGIGAPDRRRGRYQEDKEGDKIIKPGPSRTPRAGAGGGEAAVPPDPAVLTALLTACRPVDGPALDWLTKTKRIAPAVVAALGLRFCGREYRDIMADLTTRFGDAALLTAGLLKRSKTGRMVPSFWHYFAQKAGFLVIPYLKDGRPVYLKVRPPMGKEDAERRGLVRFLNTAARVPCLYNVDALAAQPDKVLICEGESDTWTALSSGFAAVGSPGAKNFKAAWVEGFRGLQDAGGRSTVYLVLDADKAGAEGSRVIADLFLKAGLPVPLQLILDTGADLNDIVQACMQDGKSERMTS